MQTFDASALESFSDYRERRQRLFPSEGSLQWYLRQHKQGLAHAGAILLIAGRWYINAEKFDQYLMEAGQAKAVEAASGDATAGQEAGHVEQH